MAKVFIMCRPKLLQGTHTNLGVMIYLNYTVGSSAADSLNMIKSRLQLSYLAVEICLRFVDFLLSINADVDLQSSGKLKHSESKPSYLFRIFQLRRWLASLVPASSAALTFQFSSSTSRFISGRYCQPWYSALGIKNQTKKLCRQSDLV
jgi:hypothetical protein